MWGVLAWMTDIQMGGERKVCVCACVHVCVCAYVHVYAPGRSTTGVTRWVGKTAITRGFK